MCQIFRSYSGGLWEEGERFEEATCLVGGRRQHGPGWEKHIKQRVPETVSLWVIGSDRKGPCQIKKLQGGLGESFPLIRIALGCNCLSRKITFTRSAPSLELRSLSQCFSDMRLRICPRTKCGNFITSFQRKSIYQK